MKRRMTIEIDERAAVMADKMIADGSCDTMDDAIERSVVIASVVDAENLAFEESWSPEFKAELIESVRESLENPQPAPPGFRAELLAKLRRTSVESAAG